ncbi:putative Subtilisin [uncultured Paludibacter sp.]|uniref:Putative Subtilisin n=1 Tax=uncultured Paludibacter sp. TaxID=497635 RepID=A0A653ACQ0_9BACT|nr:putative Subtilisin [uncultured Paludibacter sp.]
MKRIILMTFITIVNSFMIFGQNDYYWYKNQKIFVEKLVTKHFIVLDNSLDSTSLKVSLPTSTKIKKWSITKNDAGILPYKNNPISETKWAIIEDNSNVSSKANLMNNKSVKYETSFYLTSKKVEVGLSNLFYVKLKDTNDINLLEKMALENGATIVGNNKFMPLWYTLSCSNSSKGNALQMANLFYETQKFSAAEPNFMNKFDINCVNDTYFSQQWNLNNTGQNGGTIGIDIHFCQARQITTGNSNIIVAVIDQGVELNHPDLVNNIYSSSYDCQTGTSPSVVRGSHGTACAGIIGAVSNNNLGVSGIASSCRLMSISNDLWLRPNVEQELANGFNWARQNGASVISNSWGHNSLASTFLDDAITNALTLGRNGLGCVVVFATGNNDGSVIYPANSNPDILAVGAMSPCAQRKNPSSCDGEYWWGSDYGPELDIVAPGVLIPTTDRQGSNGYNTSTGTAGDYYMTFNGTSSATPHVAAVAALILSRNPNLTQRQVADIIESTAQKVGSYTYQTTTGRTNGTWNNDMGYGLLDAYAAVQAATPAVCNPPILQNVTRSGTTVTYYWDNNNTNNTTIGLQYSIDGGTTWVSNHGGATSPRSWSNVPDVRPIKFRVLGYAPGCSETTSNVIEHPCIAPTLQNIVRSGTTTTFYWSNNITQYFTIGLQYSTDGGTTWVSNHGSATSPRSWSNVPDVSYIKYRVLGYSYGCSGVASNILIYSCNPPVLQNVERNGTTVTYYWDNNYANNTTIGLQYSIDGGTTWVSNHGGATSPRSWSGVPAVYPIKYRVLGYSSSCSGTQSNILTFTASGMGGVKRDPNLPQEASQLKEEYNLIYNSATGVLKVNYPQNVKILKLYNVLGRIIMQQETNNTLENEFNINNLPAGIYIVTFDKSCSRKFVK